MDGNGEYVERGPGEEEYDGVEVEDEVCYFSPVSLSNDLTRYVRPSAWGQIPWSYTPWCMPWLRSCLEL